MIWNFLIQIGIALALSALSYVIAPKPKVPNSARGDPTREFDDPTADVGRPIPVVFGTVNVKSPNILFFTDKASRAIKRKSRAEYRMTLHYGICQGPVDSIRRVRINEKTMLASDVDGVLATDTDIDLPEFNGGKEKEGGIRGRFLWQNGAFTQTMPDAMAEPYGEAADDLPGYRGIVTAMFREYDTAERKGFLWGQSPFIPPADFMVTRIPPDWYPVKAEIAFPAGVTTTLMDEVTSIGSYLGPNANPAHIIHELMTDSVWGAGIDAAFLDDDSFRAAADTFYTEGLGLSFQWDSSREVQDLISEVLEHVEAVLYASPLTGLLALIPLRGGYDLDTLDEYDESNSKVMSTASRLPGEIPNEIALTWTNPASEKTELVTLQNLAGVDRAGTTIDDNRSLPGIRDVKTAWEVAERELAATTEEMLAVEIELDRSAWGLVPGDVFRLTSEDHQIENRVVRAIRVDYGSPREPQIKVNAIEDVFGRTIPQFTRPGQGGVPTNPRRFRLTAEDGGVLLDWDVPESDGGSPILRYQFQQDGGAWQDASGLATSHRVSGLVNGQTYTFRVRAVNVVGPGIPSVQLRIGPDDTTKTVPTVPRDFQAIGIGEEAEITWAEPLSDGGATIIRYEYELDDSGVWIVIPEGDEFLHRILGLELEQEYEIKLRAVNSVGNGEETFAATFQLRDGLNPAYARPPMAEGLKARSGIEVVLLLWENPFGHYQNHARTLIYRNTSNDFSSAVQIGTDAGVMYADRTVTGGETYWYWIAWQSQTSIIGDETGPVSVEVAENPVDAITRLSAEIRADSFTRELLAPIDGIPSIQAMATQIVQEYLDLISNVVAVVEEDSAGAAAIEALTSRVITNEDGITSISTSLTQLMNTVGGLASSAALMALTSRVTVNENDITSQSALVTTLMNDIMGLATSTALQALTSRVSDSEGDITSLSASVTVLMNEIMGLATSTALQTLQSRVTTAEGDITSVSESVTTLINDIMGLASAAAVDQLENRVTSVEGSVTSQATRITGLETTVLGLATSAALMTLQSRVTSVEGSASANATAITQLQADFMGMVTAQAFMELTARVTSAENVDGSTTLSGLARWLVKTQVNQLTGGVGLLNDGSSVKFYVAANRFAIIPPGVSDTDDGLLPFIVDNGVVYINIAAIADASIGTAKIINGFLDQLTATHGTLAHANIEKGNVFDLVIGNQIQSDNFSATQGWRITRAGQAIFDLANVRGTLSADHIDADVRNWRRLWRGNQAVQTSVVSIPVSVSDYDTLYILQTRTSGSPNWSQGSIAVDEIGSGVTPSTNNTIAFATNTRVRISQSGGLIYLRQDGSVGARFREIWGLRAPSDEGFQSTTSVTANAGSDTTVESGGSVLLLGSAAVQNPVGANSYSWRIVSGPSGGTLNRDYISSGRL